MEEAVCDAPSFDAATEYSFKWFDRLRDVIESQVRLFLLLEYSAVKSEVEKSLGEHPQAIFVHYDHGDEDRLIGQDKLPVIDLTNIEFLKGREVYVMACLSAKTLGKAAYAMGCLAYWGNTEVVSFTSDAERYFGEAFNYGLLLRLEGRPWKECLELAKERMTEIMDELNRQGNFIAAALLMGDRDSLVCYDGSVPPEPPSPPPPEPCIVSRMIVAAFGYRTLAILRRARNFLLKLCWKVNRG